MPHYGPRTRELLAAIDPTLDELRGMLRTYRGGQATDDDIAALSALALSTLDELVDMLLAAQVEMVATGWYIDLATWLRFTQQVEQVQAGLREMRADYRERGY